MMAPNELLLHILEIQHLLLTSSGTRHSCGTHRYVQAKPSYTYSNSKYFFVLQNVDLALGRGLKTSSWEGLSWSGVVQGIMCLPQCLAHRMCHLC